MSFTAALITRRHTVWALILASMLMGTVSYLTLPVQLFPDTAPPLVSVVTPWPGASGEDVESAISEVLEAEFASLEGLVKVRSVSQDNLSRITLEFGYDREADLAAVAVQNAIARVSADLPPDLDPPRVMTFSTADRPVYSVAVGGDEIAARAYAEDTLAPLLQRLPGVAAVDVFGGREPVVRVDADMERLESLGLPLAKLGVTLQEGQRPIPAGRNRGAREETLLRVDERAEHPEDLAEWPVAVPGGAVLPLDALAEVYADAREAESWFSVQGHPGVGVSVYRTDDANTVDVVDSVQSTIREIQSNQPPFPLTPGEETASFTEDSVAALLDNVWQALALASFTLFLFLGRWRTSLVTAISMPLSYALTFWWMKWAGLDLNMVTLSAVILAVGMVVDATVVVLENIVRLRDEEGLSPVEAAIRGTEEVQLSVLAGAATTLIVLVPLMGLSGFMGKTFAPLAETLLFAFAASLVVALAIVPLLTVYATDGGVLDRLGLWLVRPFHRLMDATLRAYLGLLGAALRHPILTLGLAGLSFAIGAGTLARSGMNMLPKMDSGAFTVAIEMESGSALGATRAVVQEVEALLLTQPEVRLVQSQAGYEAGMSGGGGGAVGPTQGLLSVTLSPRTARDASLWEVEDRVRAALVGQPGVVNAVVTDVGATAKANTLAPLVARLTGPDPLVLDRLGDQVLERLRGVPEVVAPTRVWRYDLRRVTLDVAEDRAAAQGLTPRQLALTLAMGGEGLEVGEVARPLAKALPIVLRAAPENRTEASLDWSVPLAEPGASTRVRDLVTVHEERAQGLLTRENLSPTLEVTALLGDAPLNHTVAAAEAALADLTVPAGYTLEMGGENSDLSTARDQIIGTLGISIVAVYLLLVAQFRSWLHPAVVMAAIPLSLAGVSLALQWSGKPVSMPVMVGLVLLVGTVVNNSILLVDVTRELRAGGMPRAQALQEAVKTRFRPILMTSLSTIIGMIPLHMEWALGAERFSPLATTVIGGLSASTLLTLVVIPVLYDVSERAMEFLPRMKGAVPAMLVALALVGSTEAQAQVRTLDEAIALAEASHPSLVALEAAAKAAEARADGARARMLPSAELSASSFRLSEVEPALLQIPLTMPDGSQPEPLQLGEVIETRSALTATLTQPLWTGGALWAGAKGARNAAEAANHLRDDGALRLRLGVTEAWYGLWLAQAEVALRRESWAQMRARADQSQRLAEAGRATALDASAIALRALEAEAELQAAQERERLADVVLRAWLDLPADAAISPSAPILSSEPVTPTLEEARAASPALLAVSAQAEAAQSQRRATAARLSPTVALRASAQYANPNSRYFPAKVQWDESWDAGVVASWSLDSGVSARAVQAANADARAANASVERADRDLAAQVARSATAESAAIRALNLANTRVTLAREVAASAVRARDEGRLTELEWTDRARELLAAEVALKGAEVQAALATARALSLRGPTR